MPPPSPHSFTNTYTHPATLFSLVNDYFFWKLQALTKPSLLRPSNPAVHQTLVLLPVWTLYARVPWASGISFFLFPRQPFPSFVYTIHEINYIHTYIRKYTYHPFLPVIFLLLNTISIFSQSPVFLNLYGLNILPSPLYIHIYIFLYT